MTRTAAASGTSAAARSAARSVDYQNIDKAYDDGEHTVVITDEDFKSLPAENSREIEVVEFVPSDQIDPIMFDRSYYLEPDSKSSKAYVLLRKTLEETDRTAIVQFALRQKTRLAALRVRGKVLMLQTAALGGRSSGGQLPVPGRDGTDLRQGEGNVRGAGGFVFLGLHARRLHRRVPGATPHPDRGEAGAGRSRWTRRRPSARRKRKKAARSWT